MRRDGVNFTRGGSAVMAGVASANNARVINRRTVKGGRIMTHAAVL